MIRSNEEKIYLEGRCSENICDTVRYMKYHYGFEHIKSIRKNGKHKAVMTMKEEYYDEDISEILRVMSKVFYCSVLAEWGE